MCVAKLSGSLQGNNETLWIVLSPKIGKFRSADGRTDFAKYSRQLEVAITLARVVKYIHNVFSSLFAEFLQYCINFF